MNLAFIKVTRTMNELFHRVAARISYVAGLPFASIISIIIIVSWALTGPLFDYSDTWQLIINTGTTIVTFLMVFLIQNTQNRDAKAVHLKLDELLKVMKGARNSLVNVEEMSDSELETLQAEFRKLHEDYGIALLKRQEKKKATLGL